MPLRAPQRQPETAAPSTKESKDRQDRIQHNLVSLLSINEKADDAYFSSLAPERPDGEKRTSKDGATAADTKPVTGTTSQGKKSAQKTPPAKAATEEGGKPHAVSQTLERSPNLLQSHNHRRAIEESDDDENAQV